MNDSFAKRLDRRARRRLRACGGALAVALRPDRARLGWRCRPRPSAATGRSRRNIALPAPAADAYTPPPGCEGRFDRHRHGRGTVAAGARQHSVAGRYRLVGHDLQPGAARGPGECRRARGLAIQAGLYPNPRFDTGNPQQLGGSNTLFDGGLTQEWVRGGKLKLDVAAAEQAVRQAQLAYTRQQFDLLTDVRQQFFSVLADQERVIMFRNLVAIAKKSPGISQNKLLNGQGTETDMLLLRIDLRRIQVSLQNTETMLRAGRQQLAALVGLPQLPIERLVGDLGVDLPDFDDEAVRQQTLARNAQVQIARTDIAAQPIAVASGRSRADPQHPLDRRLSIHRRRDA